MSVLLGSIAERELLVQIVQLLPNGAQFSPDDNQLELVLATIQYINTLQSLAT